MINLSYPISSERCPAEIQAILEYIPGAALLIDVRDEHILYANQPAAALGGYPVQELTGRPLETFLPGFAEKNAPVLLQANGRQVEVRLQQKLLPPLGFWALLFLEELAGSPEKQRQQAIQDLQNLAARPWSNNEEETIPQILQIANLIGGSQLTAFYQVDATQPGLKLAYYSQASDLLPEQLTLGELAKLQSPHLWVPQERPLTNLHRTARAAQLSYVASAPAGEPNAWIGIIVAVGIQRQPPDLALPIVQLLARYLTGVTQINRQLQQLKQQFDAQHKQLARQLSIHDTLRDGILWVSSAQKLESMNSHAEQMLGYASSEVRGQPIENILIGEQSLPRALELAQNIGYAHDMGDVTIYRRDGKPLLVGMRIQALQVEGQFNGWAILMQDLSQEQQYRIRSQQLEQRALLGEVTAIFAHEVRNPINNISTALQLMAMELPPDAPQLAPIDRMQQDCDRLSELMKSVLAFARPQEYKLQPLDVAPFLQRLLERWHPRLARTNVKEELHIEPETPQILADARTLEQVFTNLIQNAAQAMGEDGGKLIMSIRQSLAESGQHFIEVTLADTGPGIPEEQREHIFEPFFTTKVGGTGLGLAITKQIITAHRGTIRVTSIPGGTAFQVLLPVYQQE